jgi:hypothetical protein
MTHAEPSGERFECTSAPYPWPHGLGVRIDVATHGQRVACVQVLCAREWPKYPVLVSLSSSELCALALNHFVGMELCVTFKGVLEWQRTLSMMGHQGVSPLIARFPD